MSYSGVCSLSSFSNCAVVISGISFAWFDILFLLVLIFCFLKYKKDKMEKLNYSPKGFWRGHSAIKNLAREAKVSEKQHYNS